MDRDVRGVEIKVGDRVAYNASGEVHPGEVLLIKDTLRYGRAGKLFVIRNIILGGESKVTKARNLLVINED